MEPSIEKLLVRGVYYRFFIKKGGNSDARVMFFLHGFTGSHRSFEHLYDAFGDEYTIIAPDLLGHGQTDSPKDAKRFNAAEQVADILDIMLKLNLENPILIGYSMGARLALQFAVHHPEKLSGLVLESGTYGIRNAMDAEIRRKSDRELARLIQTDFDSFLKKWEALPLFESKLSIPEELHATVNEIRRSQNPQGLAASLLGFGTGSMPALFWEEIQKITCPVLLITGALDNKFTNLAIQLHNSLKSAEHHVVKDCGHRVHLESPNSYIDAIKLFLNYH